ncbi:hypothetical protein SLEP1_g40013 [Rubroshorea leprosula]|uniref:AARP2CN domain-containing protein n=1 Tax=Rubroshorea leprosula TaxID=152421 RepID=A0AAV5L2J9_9ROSI|nr:hypothetical protein SLEP1_g40013 [Rubroshorea leprosula]
MWLFKEQELTAPHWRNPCPYLIAQEFVTVPDDSSPGKSIRLLTGYMRAHSLSVNQLVHVICCLAPDLLKQEPLLVENVPDTLAGEQTWPTEAEMAEADRNLKQKMQRKRILPPGTSEYQAAWIVDNTDEEDSDTDNDDDDGMVLDEGESGFHSQGGTNNQDFEEDQASLNLRDSDDETENDSVMMEGENSTREQ